LVSNTFKRKTMFNSTIIPVVLCGGAGTRLWPMSRRLFPKQFLPLVTGYSMLQDTVLRLDGISNAEPAIIVTGNEHRFLVTEQLREIDRPAGCIVLEPIARNTAPAVAAAAFAALAQHREGVLVILPSDILIRDSGCFYEAVERAVLLAKKGMLVTFGIVPNAPETGFGYIERGLPLEAAQNAYRVARFVEKPDAATAKRFLELKCYLWNSGMFVFSAARYIEELGRFRPDILAAAENAWQSAARDLDFVRLGAEAFSTCPAVSVDYAVMERTREAAVVQTDMGWSDVGSWSALWEVAEKDANGNALRGDVDLHDSRNNYVRAESRLVSVTGVDNVVVVETSDAVLVAHRDKTQAVKDVVSRLHGRDRTEHLSHKRVYRPWGYYEGIDEGTHFQVKRLMVKPGEALSLQLHHRRAEHWVVVSGIARVTRDEETIELGANQSTYVPVGAKHRLENPGQDPLYVIEVQSGDYLGEDDIVRFEDRYRRD
jgi:mannose-1-phosphate guanylyltransferase / mannose-6-phosphate isomerase